MCPVCGADTENLMECKNCGWKESKPTALVDRDEKIAGVVLKIDCAMVDARTRTVLLYLVNQEIKKLGKMPATWSKESLQEMQGIKEGLEMCKQIRSKKPEGEQAPGWTHRIT